MVQMNGPNNFYIADNTIQDYRYNSLWSFRKLDILLQKSRISIYKCLNFSWFRYMTELIWLYELRIVEFPRNMRYLKQQQKDGICVEGQLNVLAVIFFLKGTKYLNITYNIIRNSNSILVMLNIHSTGI